MSDGMSERLAIGAALADAETEREAHERGYFAVVETDELGQIIDFGRPIWGVGTSRAAAMKDAQQWQGEVVQKTKPILTALPCTRRLYRDVKTWGGCVRYYAPGTGHRLDLVP